MARHIVIVCGYGCHLVPELQRYLDKVVEFATREQPDCFIFCGGYTQQKSAPGISEAVLIDTYTILKLKYWPMAVFWEENSYITPDNIKNAAGIIRDNDLLNIDGSTKLTVFCEATRALKVDYLVRSHIGRRADIETASWELMSPWKQLISTIYDFMTVIFPPVAWFFRWKRLRRAQKI